MTIWIPYIGYTCTVGYLALLFAKAVLSLRYFYTHQEIEEKAAAVTVLQPILGGDPYLETALRTNLKTAPPNANFIWLMDADDDIGNTVAEKVASEFPQQVKIVICPQCPPEANPKVWKLHTVLDSVETEFVAVLDDDTVLDAHHLNRAIAVLDECDLYTGLPHYLSGQTRWSSLIAHFVNNNSILTYLSLSAWIRPITINGMFYVLNTETLRRYGGFEPILNELCDDYAMAKLVRQHEGKIRQGVSSQTVQTSADSGRRYFQIMHRWFVFANVLVHDQSIGIKFLLLIFLGVPPLLFVGSFSLLATGWFGVTQLVTFLVIRHYVIGSLHRRVFEERIKFSFLHSVISELLQIVHYFHAMFSPVIQWRRHRIRVHLDGTFETQTRTEV
ncbi:glycosyltransferase [Planctomicrobium sp.]|jgi:ceramide glucosyltransferase|nr:glycosyltransferase [Planctomicrobium sp.]MDA7527588.1 glycosyltransferase [bacterium]MDB4732925.1 glycosyltransferase [Planctomicrobium sp.]